MFGGHFLGEGDCRWVFDYTPAKTVTFPLTLLYMDPKTGRIARSCVQADSVEVPELLTEDPELTN